MPGSLRARSSAEDGPTGEEPASSRTRAWAERRFELLVWALLTLTGVVVLGPALLGRGLLFDADLLTRYPPWVADGAQAGSISCRGDTVDGVMPGTANIRRGLLQGDLVTWSPYESGGTPLGALPNHGVLSPLSWPYLVLPLWLAPAYVKLTEAIVAIAGMVAFLGRLGVRRSAGALAGLVFATSGFMVMWSNWPQTRVAALIPALFWALERVVQDRRPRDVALLALVCASMLLGGFPAVTLFSLTAGAAYVVVRAVSLYVRPAREWGQLVATGAAAAAGVLLGAALSAVQLLPFVANLGELDLEGRDFAGAHLPAAQLFTALAPEVQGICRDGVAFGPVNPVEGIAFLGVGALVLLICGLTVRRVATAGSSGRLVVAWMLAVVVALVWIGGPPLSAIQLLPFYSSNHIARASSVAVFLAAAGAGYGLNRLLDRSRVSGAVDVDAGPSRLVSILVPTAVAAFLGWVTWLAYRQAEDFDYTGQFGRSLVLPSALLVIALVAAFTATRDEARLRWVGVVVLVVVVVTQSAYFAHRLLPLSERSSFYPVTQTHEFLSERLGGDRYAASGGTLYPATSDYYGLRTPVGHAFTQTRWMDLLETVDAGVALTPTFTIFPAALSFDEIAGNAVLDQLGVRYWVRPSTALTGEVEGPVPAAGPRAILTGTETARCTLPAGPLRGVQFRLARERPAPPLGGATVIVRVTDGDGTTREGGRLLTDGLQAGPLRVGVAGEDLGSTGAHTVELSFSGVAGRTVLAGSPDGDVACSAIRPSDDGLRLAHASAGALVWERLTALPRIRWAGRSSVDDDSASRLRRMEDGLEPDEVIVESAELPRAAGSTARVDVVADDPERIVVDVAASGSGYLVVADSVVREGWTATVDGEPVPLTHANHGFAGIPVPAGDHQVTLAYAAPGLRAGALVSLGGVLATGVLLVWPWARRRWSAPREQSG